MRHLIKTAGIEEAKEIASALENLLKVCGESVHLIPFKIGTGEFIALNTKGEGLDDAFGYIAITATSAGTIAIQVIKAVIYGGSDQNYTSPVTMSRHYGNDWKERAELV